LTRKEVQTALDLEQTYTREPYQERFYTPPWAQHIYDLNQLTRPNLQPEKIKFQLIKIAGGSLTLRHWNQKNTYGTLADVLRCGRSDWLLASYSIYNEGLILKFLPRRSTKLIDEAHKSFSVLNSKAHSSPSNGEPQHTIWEREEQLYRKFATIIVAEGIFQAHFDIGPNHCDIFNGDKRSIALYSIERSYEHNNYRKTTKVVYSRNANTATVCRFD